MAMIQERTLSRGLAKMGEDIKILLDITRVLSSEEARLLAEAA